MRLVAVVAVALSLAAPASASMWPPPAPQTLHTLKVSRTQARAEERTCMAHEARAKIARWLAPVACEQPPRPQLLLASALFGG